MMNRGKVNVQKKAWPIKEAMEQVYEMNLWGGDTTDYYSGVGSHHPEIVTPYVDSLIAFLNSFENLITVCDLGCGDFNVGRHLVAHTKKYVAVDIVEKLIIRNKEKFKKENLEFSCLDIATEKLPTGDCAILRQVLQHLSNNEIKRILPKLYDFKYVIVSEHVPSGDFIPNKDIITGQGIRLKKGSGVNLVAPPFNFNVKEERKIASIPFNSYKGILVTTRYEIF